MLTQHPVDHRNCTGEIGSIIHTGFHIDLSDLPAGNHNRYLNVSVPSFAGSLIDTVLIAIGCRLFFYGLNRYGFRKDSFRFGRCNNYRFCFSRHLRNDLRHLLRFRIQRNRLIHVECVFNSSDDPAGTECCTGYRPDFSGLSGKDRIDHTGFGLVEKCRIIREGFDIDAGDIAVFNGDFHFNIPVKSASGTVVGAIRIFSLRSSFCDLW